MRTINVLVLSMISLCLFQANLLCAQTLTEEHLKAIQKQIFRYETGAKGTHYSFGHEWSLMQSYKKKSEELTQLLNSLSGKRTVTSKQWARLIEIVPSLNSTSKEAVSDKTTKNTSRPSTSSLSYSPSVITASDGQTITFHGDSPAAEAPTRYSSLSVDIAR